MIRIGLAAAAFVFLAAVLSLFLGRSDAELETRKVIDAADREMKQPHAAYDPGPVRYEVPVEKNVAAFTPRVNPFCYFPRVKITDVPIPPEVRVSFESPKAELLPIRTVVGANVLSWKIAFPAPTETRRDNVLYRTQSATPLQCFVERSDGKVWTVPAFAWKSDFQFEDTELQPRAEYTYAVRLQLKELPDAVSNPQKAVSEDIWQVRLERIDRELRWGVFRVDKFDLVQRRWMTAKVTNLVGDRIGDIYEPKVDRTFNTGLELLEIHENKVIYKDRAGNRTEMKLR